MQERWAVSPNEERSLFCQPFFHLHNTPICLCGVKMGRRESGLVNTTPIWVNYDVSFHLTASCPVTALTLFLSIFHPQTICPAEYLKIPLEIQKLYGMKCSEYPLPIFPRAFGTVFRWASVQVKIEVLSWYHMGSPTGSSAGLGGRQGEPGYCKHCAVRGNKLGKGLFLVKIGVTAPRISSHLTRKIPMDFNQGTRKWGSRNILCLISTCLNTPAQSLLLIMIQRKGYLCLKTYNVPFVY